MDNAPNYISQERQEEFERFLLNQMELEEETVFHKKLDSDALLKTQFEEFKALFFAIEEEGLRKVLNDFHQTLPKKKTLKKYNFNFYRIAAGITIIVALGIWVFTQKESNEKVFEAYFRPDPGLPTVMGPNDNYAFYEAMVDYKQGNYKVAIEKWRTLLEEKPNNDTLNYFLGSAHLANGNIESAIKFLTFLTDNETSGFYHEANTYLGLALLKKGAVPDAKFILKKSNTERSKQILSELK